MFGIPLRGRLLLPFFLALAWLAATTAGHAASQLPAPASEVDRAVADLAAPEPEPREAAVATLGRTGDPRWLAFLGALRDGNVYLWKRKGHVGAPEMVVGGAKTSRGDTEVVEVARAYDRQPLGAAPVAELIEVSADRRLRLAIKPFLDADETRSQLASPDPAMRRAVAAKLGNQAEATALGLVEAALACRRGERVPAARTPPTVDRQPGATP